MANVIGSNIPEKLIICSILLFPIHVKTRLLKIFWQNIFQEKMSHYSSLHNCSFNQIDLPIYYFAIQIKKQPNQVNQNLRTNRLLAFLENQEKLSQRKWSSMKWIQILKYPPSYPVFIDPHFMIHTIWLIVPVSLIRWKTVKSVTVLCELLVTIKWWWIQKRKR